MEAKSQKLTGGVIVAAGKRMRGRELNPLLKIGSITAVKRIVLTFQQAGISPIVVVTGRRAEEIEHDLANYGVIFLKNEQYETSELFDSAKIGLAFLQNKCDQIIFSPVNIPLVTPGTIRKMLECGKSAISPSYRGKSGHPLLLPAALIPRLLQYNGGMGMRGALASAGIAREWMDIDDAGIVHDMDDIDRMDELLQAHNQHILHPFVKISIEKETLFFNSKTKLLLLLIQDTHSVRSACRHIALSYSKAWNMLNQLERELGYSVVERKHGGSKGGKTYLTSEGALFLEKFQQFEKNVRSYAKEEFHRLF